MGSMLGLEPRSRTYQQISIWQNGILTARAAELKNHELTVDDVEAVDYNRTEPIRSRIPPMKV